MKFRTYTIEKMMEYESAKVHARRTNWVFSGDVTMTNLDLALRDLINQMTIGEPENVRVQLSIRFLHSDKQPHTKLISKQDAIDQLYDWISYIVEYREVHISDAIITLLKIEVPTGAGFHKSGKIVNKNELRSVIQIRNDDTLCCGKSILVCLAVNFEENVQLLFKNRLNKDEIERINKERRSATNIQNGIISDNEITYLKQVRSKLLTVLAQAFHRLTTIPIREKGNSLSDVNLFAMSLTIQINVYARN